MGAIRRECADRKAPPPTASRRRSGLFTVVVACLAFLVVIVPLGVSPGPGSEPSEAIASGPLTAHCDGPPVEARGSGRDRPIVVSGPWMGAEAEAFRSVLERFSRKTGVRIVYAHLTRETATTLLARLHRGCPPDVALLPQPGLLRDLAQRGYLKPLKRPTQELVKANLDPFWRRQASVGDTLYGVWFKAANKSTFWYSRPQFDRAGVTSPATWPDLMRAAATLDSHDLTPFSVAGADGWTLTDWFENIYLRTAGHVRYDELAEHRIGWTHPTVRIALERMSDILRRPWLAGGYTTALMKTSFEKSVDQVFAERPTAAMTFEGDFVSSQIEPEQAGEAGVFPFPAIAGSGPSMVVGGDVATVLTDRDEGQQLVRFLASVEAARILAREGGLSPNRRLDQRAYANPTRRRLAQSLIDVKTKRFDLSDLQPPALGAKNDEGMPALLRTLLSGGADIATIARKLEVAASRAYKCDPAGWRRSPEPAPPPLPLVAARPPAPLAPTPPEPQPPATEGAGQDSDAQRPRASRARARSASGSSATSGSAAGCAAPVASSVITTDRASAPRS